MNISADIKTKIDKIVEYLRAGGCSRIFLFGSLAEGGYKPNSDIDIAVSGISSKEFFKAIARLPLIVKHRVDLVDFDDLPLKFQKSIKNNGVLLYGS